MSKVNFFTPDFPKYSFIKSVTTKTIGHGKIPTLKIKGPMFISLPPISSATIALVIKMPPKIANTICFFVSFMVVNLAKKNPKPRFGIFRNMFTKDYPKVTRLNPTISVLKDAT